MLSDASRACAMRTGFSSPGRSGLAELGALVRALRLGAGLTQRALARRSTCAPSTISRLERGQLRPRRSLLGAVGWGIDPDRAKEIRAALFAAAGDNLAADTPGWRRYRARRTEAGMLAGDVPLPTQLARRIDAHKRRAALWQAADALMDTPGALDDAAILDRANQMLAEASRLAAEAGGTIAVGSGRRRVVYGLP